MNKLNLGITPQKLALNRVEAAQALSISPATLDRLSTRGLIRPSRATYRPLYALSEIERFLRDTTTAIDGLGGDLVPR